MTARCPAPCTGCYLDARPDGHEPPFEALAARLAEARAAGVSTVAFGGGEPLTRGDLGRLAAEARRLGLVPVMTTSGIGLTAARAAELRAFAQINVSHDGVDGAYEAVRGFDAAAHAERAVALLAAEGVPVGVNLVVTRASFPAIEATAARAAELGAGEIQLLRYKPAGRAGDGSYAERRLPDGAGRALWQVIARLVAAKRLRVRIDCAMVPLLSEALMEAVPDARRGARGARRLRLRGRAPPRRAHRGRRSGGLLVLPPLRGRASSCPSRSPPAPPRSRRRWPERPRRRLGPPRRSRPPARLPRRAARALPLVPALLRLPRRLPDRLAPRARRASRRTPSARASSARGPR